MEKKSPAILRGCAGRLNRLQQGNIACRRSLGAVDNFELYPCALVKALVALAGDGGIMYENISAVILLDETKSLCLVKPFCRSL